MSRFCLGMGMAGGEGVAMEVGGSRLAPGGALAPLRRSASAACGVPACVAVADSRSGAAAAMQRERTRGHFSSSKETSLYALLSTKHHPCVARLY